MSQLRLGSQAQQVQSLTLQNLQVPTGVQTVSPKIGGPKSLEQGWSLEHQTLHKQQKVETYEMHPMEI